MPRATPEARTCRSCGHVSSGEDRFCPKCGTTLPGLTAAEHMEISQAPTVVTPSDPGLAPRGAPTAPEPASGAPAPSAAAEALEEQLRAALSPSFLLVRKLGEGGMASVYLAREPALRRLVAVKVLAPQLAVDPHARARFEREAQAVAGLSHPNILGIYGLGELGDGSPYFVMQYVSGKSLAGRIEEEGPLDPDEARRITGEVAAALAAAHAKGIVHRDIKPANILHDDEAGRALVSDFGIAAVRAEHAEDGTASTKLTGTGMMVGTPAYMSPEQMLAEPVTEKTDVYALGLLGYELAVGHGPFQATTPQELIAAHLRDVPRPLSELRKDVDPEFAGLVAGCLEKDARKRPTAAEVAKRLSPGGGVPLEWPPPGLDALHGALRKWSARLWLGNILLIGIGALGFIAFGTSLTPANQSLGTLLLALCVAFGGVLLLLAYVSIVRAFRAAPGAVRRGYTWLTVLETMADVRRDTGALVAGVREYASVEPRIRSALRSARVARDLLAFCSAAAPLALLLLLVWLGSAGAFPAAGAPFLVLGLPLVALAAAAVLERTEQRTLQAARHALARRRKREDFGKLVEPWYLSFESVREGQPLGRGRPGGARLGWVGGLAVGVAAIAIVVATVPLWVVAAAGPLSWQLAAPTFTGTMRKLAIANRVRPYRAPVDTSISPGTAGEAFLTLVSGLSSGNGRERASDDSTEQPLVAVRPAPRQLPPLPELRGSDTTLFPRGPAWNGPDVMEIIRLAARGFNPAQRRWLATLAAHPAWREFTTVARAPTFDALSAQFTLPFADTVRPETVWQQTIPRFTGTKLLAYANASRAAYFLDQGRRDLAEEAIRETIAFGFQLVDHGPSIVDALIGVVLTGIGRYQLTQFYAATGDERAVALQSLQDSINSREGEFASLVLTDAEAAEARTRPRSRADWRTELRDAAVPAGIRLENLNFASWSRCTNVRELVFGRSRDIDEAIATARREMARNAGDSAMIDLIQRAARRGPRVRDDLSDAWGTAIEPPLPVLAAIKVARVLGRGLNNSALPGCAAAAVAMAAGGNLSRMVR